MIQNQRDRGHVTGRGGMSGRRVELSTSLVIANVLAAVTGAVAAAYLGVAGTIVGAALASFASTTGTAVYRHYLAQTEEKLKTAASGVVHRASAWGEPGLPGQDSSRESAATAAGGQHSGAGNPAAGRHTGAGQGAAEPTGNTRAAAPGVGTA